MSWFSADFLKELGKQVHNMLQKLTEEKHKERVKNTLAGMLPWETRDPERDILVEECKKAILQLSADKETFHGPYEMPKASANLNTSTSSNDEGDVEDKIQEPFSPTKPSVKSLEKLKTLEPLPILLENFDLDSHVGLIEKLLQADPKLVEMQSLSGTGEHEVVFWRNYIFHCAWCRYEAGLSIDEIWSDEPAPEADASVVSSGEAQLQFVTPPVPLEPYETLIRTFLEEMQAKSEAFGNVFSSGEQLRTLTEEMETKIHQLATQLNNHEILISNIAKTQEEHQKNLMATMRQLDRIERMMEEGQQRNEQQVLSTLEQGQQRAEEQVSRMASEISAL